tara:strand:- start:658 stop:1143 length:486 start_codon:yes stop_codon:yes gene_type:complete
MPKIDLSQQLAKLFEPIRQNRFFLEVDGIPSFMVKTFQRPKISNGSIEIDYINVKRYLTGKTTVNTVTLTMHDPIEQSGKQAVQAWQKAHYDFQTGRAGYSDDYMREMTVKELSPAGDIISEIVLHRCFIVDLDLGNYDYASAEPVEISLTIQYDGYEVKA